MNSEYINFNSIVDRVTFCLVVIYSNVLQFQHLMNVYFSFCRSIRSPPLRTRKKMFSTVFSESRVLPQKKKTFGFTKKAKSQTEKTPNCHKTKTRMKEKKKSSKQRLTPHTHTPDRSSTTYIH